MSTKKLIITLVIGTLLLFLWNAISWMALPFHTNTFTNIPEAAIDLNALRDAMPKSGIYHYPGLPESNNPKAIEVIENKLAQGPRITFMAYTTGPTKLFDPTSFGLSFLINLFTVFLSYLLIARLAKKNLKTILIATLLVGMLLALVGDLGLMNWYLLPVDYTAVNVMDKLIGFALLGLLFGLYTFKSSKQEHTSQ